jgi:hypothetical protein
MSFNIANLARNDDVLELWLKVGDKSLLSIGFSLN